MESQLCVMEIITCPLDVKPVWLSSLSVDTIENCLVLIDNATFLSDIGVRSRSAPGAGALPALLSLHRNVIVSIQMYSDDH